MVAGGVLAIGLILGIPFVFWLWQRPKKEHGSWDFADAVLALFAIIFSGGGWYEPRPKDAPPEDYKAFILFIVVVLLLFFVAGAVHLLRQPS